MNFDPRRLTRLERPLIADLLAARAEIREQRACVARLEFMPLDRRDALVGELAVRGYQLDALLDNVAATLPRMPRVPAVPRGVSWHSCGRVAGPSGAASPPRWVSR